MDLAYIGTLILLILGFGFVVFWHELGHFLAAKWAGVKVEQFAVGFGHAILSWRKGLGVTLGSSGKRYEQILKAETEGPNRIDHLLNRLSGDLLAALEAIGTPHSGKQQAQIIINFRDGPDGRPGVVARAFLLD